MFSGLDMYCADPAQPLTTAGEELDDLLVDHDLPDLSVRGVLLEPPSRLGEGRRRSYGRNSEAVRT